MKLTSDSRISSKDGSSDFRCFHGPLEGLFALALDRRCCSYLSSRFVDADFDFHGKVLTGKKENLPRWKRIVNATNHAIGEAVGQTYVKTALRLMLKLRL